MDQDDPALPCSGPGNHPWRSKKGFGNLDLVTDAELAKELFELTVEERAKVLDDVHGVANVQIETPEFVDSRLRDLDKALAEIPKSRRKAMDRAVLFKPNALKDSKFKLMFLRAEHYDASKAAGRIERYFLWKIELFGDSYITKQITLDDLDDKCMNILREGTMVEFPHTDQTGRSIWFFDLAKFAWSDSISMFRCIWYLMMNTSIGNAAAQMKGVCHVANISTRMNPKESLLPNYRDILLKMGDMVESLPIRASSVHSCIRVSDKWLDTFAGLIRAAVGKSGRLRLRIHIGTGAESKYALRTFGIDCGKMLEDNEGNKEKGSEHYEMARQYLKRRQEIERVEKEAQEREEAKSGVILCPKLDDVLMERGRPFRVFRGSQRWSKLIEDRLERYQNCPDRFSKTCISIEVVTLVHEYGGRFIHRVGAGWEILDDDVAREKTLRAFRPRIMKNNPDTIGSGDMIGSDSDGGDDPRPPKRVKSDPTV